MFGKLQKLPDAARLDDGEALPRPRIVEHGRVHALFFLHGLEPHAVHGQPVFGVDVQKFDELFAAQCLERPARIHKKRRLSQNVCPIIARAV